MDFRCKPRYYALPERDKIAHQRGFLLIEFKFYIRYVFHKFIAYIPCIYEFWAWPTRKRFPLSL